MKTITLKSTPAQIRAIHALARKRGFDEITYRGILAQFGAAHSTDLSRDQAMTLIKFLRGKPESAIYPASNYSGSGARGTRISDHLTQRQADEIARLEEKLGMTDNPKRLYGLIRHVLGKQCSPSMLMKFEASKLIIVMRKMRGVGDAN
jgi:hypothetical protein